MTAATAAPTDRGRMLAQQGLPWALVLLATIALAGVHGSVLAQTLHLIYFLLLVVLPGVMAWRALRGPEGNWAELAGFGAALGLLWELIGWAAFTALGIQHLLIVWPLLAIAALLAVPVAREGIRRPLTPAPLRWHWAMAAVAVLAEAYVLLHETVEPVPTTARDYYPDLLYYLGMVQEGTHSFPMQTPQAAGLPMQYHWFVYAHMAASSDITGADPRQVLFRLWIAPIVLILILATAGLARICTRAWWSGPLAAGLMCFGLTNLRLGPSWVGTGNSVLSYLGPTAPYAAYVSVVLAALLVPALRGQPLRRTHWVLVGLLGALSTGAKPTIFPVILAGIGAAFLVALFSRNRLVLRRTVALIVGLGVLTVVSLKFLTGSSAGTPIRFMGLFRLAPGYSAATGDHIVRGTGSWIIGGLQHPSAAALGWALLQLVIFLAAFGLIWVALAVTIIRPEHRRDPALWFLMAVPAAGLGPLLLMDQPAYAEVYFLGQMAPFLSLAALTVLAADARRLPAGRRRSLAIETLAVGFVAVTLLGSIALGHPSSPWGWNRALAKPLLVAVLVAGALVLAWRRFWRPTAPRAGAFVAVLLVCGGVLAGSTGVVRAYSSGAETGRPADYTSDQLTAANWIRSTLPSDAVFVTPTACRRSVRSGCDARGYLISGIAGRRALVEGWGYLNQNYAQFNDQPVGTYYAMAPSPFPERSALTKETMTNPTASTMQRLRGYHVGYIFTDDTVSTASKSTLAGLAHQIYSAGSVRIYQIK